jgi:hypothetical protein
LRVQWFGEVNVGTTVVALYLIPYLRSGGGDRNANIRVHRSQAPDNVQPIGIESVNMCLRKITKNRGSFPSDEALLKLFYLALNNIAKKWTMPVQNWKPVLNRFTIQFGERMLTN